jgi:hypothetical protein
MSRSGKQGNDADSSSYGLAGMRRRSHVERGIHCVFGLFSFLAVSSSAPVAHAKNKESTSPAPVELVAHSYPALGAGVPKRVDVAWNRFYDHAGLSEILRQLHAAYPDLTRLYSIGRSQEGRELWCLEISAGSAAAASRKPGMYIDGNIHGNEVQGGEAVAYTAWYLLNGYGRVAQVTHLLDTRVFYLIPTINPDGRDAWLRGPHSRHSSRSGRVPLDNDKDGLVDEDDYDDLDQDGSISTMRIADPAGRWRPSPDFPEYLMERVEADEVGGYSILGYEGIDNDGDGEINEDGVGGYDPNRNWAWDWQPNYVQFGAHEFPFSLPETRAIASFALAHPNIGAMQSFHNNGGMILRGPGREGGYVNREDERIFAAIAARGESMLPFYRSMVTHSDLYPVWGGETEWFYVARGVYAFTNEMWTLSNLRRKAGEVNQEESAEFIRDLLLGEGIVPWKPYKHPLYGKIEIGGTVRQWGRVPPSFMLEEELHRNMAYTLYHADSLPLLSFSEITVQKLGPGLTRVVVAIHNTRPMATRAAVEIEKKNSRPDLLTIEGKGVKVLSAGRVEDRFAVRVNAVRSRPERLEVESIPGQAIERFAFVVGGRGQATIVFDSAKGGRLSRTIKVGG